MSNKEQHHGKDAKKTADVTERNAKPNVRKQS
jgi:hypothetical protein